MEPRIDWTQEIRFSVVMYGGVSLAIYINGVAQEFLKLVRATAREAVPATGDARPLLSVAPVDAPAAPAASRRSLESTERVYRKLGQLLAHGVAPTNDDGLAESAPIRTRFVVDVLSGTSAGGINGIYLAKALANNQSMDGLKRLWVSEGDIARLINDAISVRDLRPLAPPDPPKSLLNSRRIFQKFLHALREMDGPGEGANKGGASPPLALVDELDLFVTTTDIHGTVIPLRLADRLVHELRYRNAFHFRYDASAGQAETRNDFVARNNPVLAFSARCTSAFPFAFEPMGLHEASEVLRHFPAPGEARLDAGLLAPFLNEDSAEGLSTRAFGDGAYLDNKPFGYAIEGGAHRRAQRPVTRKLVYIEPSPEHPENEVRPRDPPNAIENVRAAVLDLPRYESIRGDLERVLARNRLVDRVTNVRRGLDDDFRRGVRGTGAYEHRDDFGENDLESLIERYGVGYGGYHRLKVGEVTDSVARTLAAAASFDLRSDVYYALRYIVRAWRDLRYRHYLSDQDRDQGLLSFNHFLLEYDVGYRIRRLRFLLDELDTLGLGGYEAIGHFRAAADAASAAAARRKEASGDTGEPDVVASATADTDSIDAETIGAAAHRLRQEIEPILGDLLRLEEGLRLSGSRNRLWRALQPETQATGDQAAELEAVTNPSSDVLELLETLLALPATERASFARSVLTQPVGPAANWVAAVVGEATSRLASTIASVMIDASSRTREVFRARPDSDDAELRRHLEREYDRFEQYDLVTFPVLYATDVGDEHTQVEVFRISPEDATPPFNKRGKLAGTAFGHFGAFLDARWRRNDMLWGRLDGADRIISALLPLKSQEPLRDRLIKEARMAILAEELSEEDRPAILDLVAEVSAEESPQARDRTTRVGLKTRISNMLRATATPEQLYKHYGHDYEVDRSLDRTVMARSAARATQVVGKMFEGMSRPGGHGRTRAAWIAQAGRAAWGLVEVAVPGSPARAIARHLGGVTAIFAALLAVGGMVSGDRPLRSLGLTWLGIVLLFLVVQALVENFLRGGRALQRALRVTVVTLVAGFLYLAARGAHVVFGMPDQVFGRPFNVVVLVPIVLLGLGFVATEVVGLVGSLLRGVLRLFSRRSRRRKVR